MNGQQNELEKLNLTGFLVGHYGSKKILQASSYLNRKYIPEEINLRYLNFGSYKTSNLHGYDFQSFGYFGSSKKYWSANLCKVLKNIDDEFVLLALDDFFLSKKLNKENFMYLYNQLKNNDEFVSAELTLSPMDKIFGSNENNSLLYVYPDTYGFSINTQWRIWRREYLISILEQTTDAWNFEVKGSKILNKSAFKSISCYKPVLDYPEISAITQRNKNKVSVFANQYIDIEALIEQGFIKLNELILGQWKTGIPSYSEYSKNQYEVLNLIDDLDEKKYYKLLLDRCLEA